MNSTGFYGVARWKKALSASLTAFALVLSSVAPLLAFPQTVLAAGYLISGSATPNGLTVNVTGQASANPYTGQGSDQHVSIDWNEDGGANPSNANGQWETVLNINASGGSFASTTWSGSHLYPTAGNKKIFVRVHHAQPGGNESGSGTVSFAVVVNPQCSDGVDNDSDGLIDFSGGDPGCTSALDDSESPNPIVNGTLVVNKVLINDNGGTTATTSFSFQIPGVNGGNPIAFEADGSNSFSLVPGAYPVTEVSAPGYGVTYSAGCTAGVSTGATTTCTVTNNDQPGTLIVKKTLTKDNGSIADFEDFAFQVNGGATTTFNTMSGQNSISVDAGTHSVVEVLGTEPLSGYTTSYTNDLNENNNCTNLVVGNGETVTCTITNDDKPATITVTKFVNNIRKSNTVESFGLSVGLEPVVSGVFELFNAGTYAITETGATGYNPVFSGACASGSITAAVGGVYECTITNTEKTPGTLTVIKIVQNDNAEEFRGTADADDFTISVTGGNPDPASFAGSATGVSVTIDGGATYNVSETGGPLSGYSVSYSADCLIQTMPEGGTKTCTVTNNDNDPTQAYITVLKNIVNDNGGEVQLNPWTLHVTDGESNVTNVTHGTANLFAPGTYTISESGGVDGYEQTGIVCSTNGGPAVEGNNIEVVAGNSYVCTITNNDIAPSLTLVKKVTNDHGGGAVATDWTVGALGATSISGAGTVSSGAGFIEGVYTLTESVGPDGYTAGEWSCTNGLIVDDNNQIEISIGQTSTCTLINDDEPATLVVIKKVINDNGGTATSTDFTMHITGTEVSESSFLGSATGVSVTLDAGSYGVSESGPSGYGTTASPDCVGTIANGQTKVCTLTNDDGKATLTIEKYTEGADGSFTFEVTGQEPIVLETIQGVASTSLALDAGTYEIVEIIPIGWTLAVSYCEYDNEQEVGEQLGDNGESVTLGVGANVTCSFYNYASGADLSIQKSVDDETPDANQTITFTLTVTNAGPATADNVLVLDVLPSGLTYVSDDSEGSYSTTTGAWTVGSLVDGATKKLVMTVTVSASAGQTVVNTASVSFEDEGVSDYVEENNDDDISVTVNTPPGGGGGDPTPPPPILGGGITGLGGGQVLGASTGQVLGESCGLFMDQYLRRGNAKNRADQVAKLQEFLIKHGYGAFTPTGFFGPLTEDAVKAFQSAYAQNVLAPWGLSQPTGLAYLTTLRQLNLIECPDLSLTVPELVEWSKNPQVAGFVAGATFTKTENITTPPSSTDESNTEESEEDEPLAEVDATSNEDASNGQKGFWGNFLKGIFGR